MNSVRSYPLAIWVYCQLQLHAERNEEDLSPAPVCKEILSSIQRYSERSSLVLKLVQSAGSPPTDLAWLVGYSRATQYDTPIPGYHLSGKHCPDRGATTSTALYRDYRRNTLQYTFQDLGSPTASLQTPRLNLPHLNRQNN